jgi:phosphopantothenoylcysteine synthetase/decarboxylase
MAKGNSGVKYNKLLTNRYVLFFIFTITLCNIVMLAAKADYVTVSIMVLVGILTSCFSKNMVVILTVALAVANILKYGANIANPWLELEGFEAKEDAAVEEKEEEKEEEAEEEEEEDDDEDTEYIGADDEDDDEEAFTTKKGKRGSGKTKKQKLIEKNSLDDLRAEMKLGFKRLNQNIDSMNMANFFA